MFKVEFKRIFLSLPTLLFYVSILALALLSFFFSTQDRATYAQVLSGGYVDIDTQKMEALIENYRGYKFAENFFFGDFGDLTTVVILLFIGIFLAPVMQNLQKSGLGNLIMVRAHYVDYLQLKIKVLLAYVASILFISFLSVTILAYVIGGYQGLADIGTGYLSFGQQMLSWLGQWLILILFFCLLAVISMLMSVVIENRYLLQLFPVIAFLLVPIFISSTLGNLYVTS